MYEIFIFFISLFACVVIFDLVDSNSFKIKSYLKWKETKEYLGNCGIETTGVVSGCTMVRKEKIINRYSGRKCRYLEDIYQDYTLFYSPIITYRDMRGELHQVNALHYSRRSPIEGRRAKVFYKADEPEMAYVSVQSKYKGKLRVLRVDEFEVICRSILRGKVRIPMELVDGEPEPGCKLIEEYGYFRVVY